MIMLDEHFAITLALARHALFAAKDCPDTSQQPRVVRHQVDRLLRAHRQNGDEHKAGKLQNLLDWYDGKLPPDNERVVLSFKETTDDA